MDKLVSQGEAITPCFIENELKIIKAYAQIFFLNQKHQKGLRRKKGDFSLHFCSFEKKNNYKDINTSSARSATLGDTN